MKIAFAASEVFPYAKAGGLGDVAGALPIELSKLEHEVKVFLPKYNTITDAEYKLQHLPELGEIPIQVAGKSYTVTVYSSRQKDCNVIFYFVDCPHYFCRYELYTNDKDEDERFILFSKSVIEILQRLQWAPDIIHCNDWPTGLIPLLLRENYGWDRLFEKTATVFTIHNIAYQGKFKKDAFIKSEFDLEHASSGGIAEHKGDINFLKTAILTSDIINTVSETYARELLTPEYGEEMNEILSVRKNDLYGILNGVDYNIWNPEKDKNIPFHYSTKDLSSKIKNKKTLLTRLDLPFDENIPLIGIVSRLVEQKGFDLVSAGVDRLMELNAQWVILGNGQAIYEEMFRKMSKKYSKKVSVYLGFYDELSHLIMAGADIFLMPSRFEPCGLGQIYALKYGTVPVVRRTGGLADTVQDWGESKVTGEGTGFSFYEYSLDALIHSVQRAVNDFSNKQNWNRIQLNGMRKDFSWRKSAEKYVALYEKAVIKRRDRN
ncbi:MAG: glycogen synthase GlgA [Ignavibacteriales bacterium]|nr:glycogen synthase GlgA [Ignavibacteriales bacterium]